MTENPCSECEKLGMIKEICNAKPCNYFRGYQAGIKKALEEVSAILYIKVVKEAPRKYRKTDILEANDNEFEALKSKLLGGV
jgi:hypothetical protein